MRELSAHTQATINLFHIEASSQGWEVEEFHWKGDSLIAHARNICLAKFLQSKCDEIFYLDSDVACGAGIFSRMLTHRVDIVAGIYRVKCDDEKYPVRWKGGVEKRVVDVRTGLLAAEGVPFGFVRISRNMVQFLVDTYADKWFNTPLFPGKVPALFSTECHGNEFWGEDFYFCRLLRQTRHMIWVDPEVPLVHVQLGRDGEAPKLYHGHLGRYLRDKGEYFNPPLIVEAPEPVPELKAVAA